MPRCRCTNATVLATVALVLLLLELLTLVLPAPRPPTSQYAQPAHSNGSDSHSGEGDSDPPPIPLFRPGSGAGSVLPLQSEPFGARTPVTPTLSPSLSIKSPDRSVYTSFIHSPPDPGLRARFHALRLLDTEFLSPKEQWLTATSITTPSPVPLRRTGQGASATPEQPGNSMTHERPEPSWARTPSRGQDINARTGNSRSDQPSYRSRTSNLYSVPAFRFDITTLMGIEPRLSAAFNDLSSIPIDLSNLIGRTLSQFSTGSFVQAWAPDAVPSSSFLLKDSTSFEASRRLNTPHHLLKSVSSSSVPVSKDFKPDFKPDLERI